MSLRHLKEQNLITFLSVSAAAEEEREAEADDKCFIKFQTSLLVKCSTLLLFKTILVKIMGYRVLSITLENLDTERT